MASRLPRQEVGQGKGEQRQQRKTPTERHHRSQCAHQQDCIHHQRQQMVADVDFTDLAATAGESMNVFTCLELLQGGQPNVQQMVE